MTDKYKRRPKSLNDLKENSKKHITIAELKTEQKVISTKYINVDDELQQENDKDVNPGNNKATKKINVSLTRNLDFEHKPLLNIQPSKKIDEFNEEIKEDTTQVRTKIYGLIKDFLLKFPEARNIFLGNSQSDKIINSPRLLKKRMAVFVEKREKRYQYIGIMMSGVEKIKKKFRIRKNISRKPCLKNTKYGYLKHFEKAEKKHTCVLDSDFDIFD